MAACNNVMTFDSWKDVFWTLLFEGQVGLVDGRGISAVHGSVELMQMIFDLVPWHELLLKFEGHKRFIELLGPEKLIEILEPAEFIKILVQEILRVNPGAVDSEGKRLTPERLLRRLRTKVDGSIHDWNLDGCGLHSLPDLIGAIRGAESISFANNQLQKLPDSFGYIQVDDRLCLNDNKLTTLPDSFSNLKCMELFLHNNQLLSNNIPSFFPNVGVRVVYELPF